MSASRTQVTAVWETRHWTCQQSTLLLQTFAPISNSLVVLLNLSSTCTLKPYVRVNAQVSFPTPFSPRPAAAYISLSLVKYGDCREPHFLSFEGIAGLRDWSLSAVASITLISKNLGKMMFPSLGPYSVISGCIATSYDAELLLATAVDKIVQMNEEKQKRLLKVLSWALGFPDIDLNSVQIRSISPEAGSIRVVLPVPPSISKTFPDASTFEATCYKRAKSPEFNVLMNDYVGFQVAGACSDGYWGVNCDKECVAATCQSARCNAVDGTTYACDECMDGYWGPMCSSKCEHISDSYHCASTQCNQDSGEFESCGVCRPGYWGDTCSLACADNDRCPTGRSVCDQESGLKPSCLSCHTGFWGSSCTDTCRIPDGCASVVCSQTDGSAVSCPTCQDG